MENEFLPMTEDEIIILELAVTEGDWPLWEANWELQSIPRAHEAICRLYKKGLIAFLYTTKWSHGDTSRISDEQAKTLVQGLLLILRYRQRQGILRETPHRM